MHMRLHILYHTIAHCTLLRVCAYYCHPFHALCTRAHLAALRAAPSAATRCRPFYGARSATRLATLHAVSPRLRRSHSPPANPRLSMLLASRLHAPLCVRTCSTTLAITTCNLLEMQHYVQFPCDLTATRCRPAAMRAAPRPRLRAVTLRQCAPPRLHVRLHAAAATCYICDAEQSVAE